MRARGLVAILGVCVATFASRVALADTKDQCVAASTDGQTLRDEGKLRAAHDRLLTCAKDDCPPIVRTACAEWLAAVDRRQPSIVVRVEDADGRDVADARVLVDGAVAFEKNAGKSIGVDPGEHMVRVERGVAEATSQTVVVVEGEKERLVTVRLPSTPLAVVVAPVDLPPRPIPVLSFVLAGAGVVGIGSFTYFGLTAKSDVDQMRSTCAPRCTDSDVGAAKTKALVADVSLGVGVGLLAAAVWVYLARPEAPSRVPVVGVWPTRGGGTIGVMSKF